MAKVALIQMVSSSDIQQNLNQAAYYIGQAKEEGAQLVVLPENFALMGLNEQDKLNHAENFGDGVIQQSMSYLSKKNNIWLICGTISIKTDKNKVRAASLVFDEAGCCVARYDKIHLFDVRVSANEAHQESFMTEPGHECVVVDTPVGKLGLTVCYDLRFPELFRQLAIQGAELFAVPSAFTAITGAAHWEVLLRARAIENLCYVLAPNQGGHHQNGRHTYGHSMIIEPWGEVIAQVNEEGEGMVSAEIDLSRLHRLRQQFPCHEHHVLFPAK